MKAGQLVPDPVMVRIVSERLRRNPDEDVLLDGFPRTVEQARALDELLASEGRKVDLVVALTAPEEVLIDRLLQRAQVQNRADDTRQAIEERMHEYHARTEPVLAHYRSGRRAGRRGRRRRRPGRRFRPDPRGGAAGRRPGPRSGYALRECRGASSSATAT